MNPTITEINEPIDEIEVVFQYSPFHLRIYDSETNLNAYDN